ncbi:MAG: TIM barrel protein [Candidatus Nanoarchaeia archaeon]|nr:TIM barrel protein [Candidatus Nanoarchaeia archaeon]
MKVLHGRAGLGPDPIGELERVSKAGLRLCEVAFTYSVYMNKEQAKLVGEAAKRLGITLTIHGQYFCNLASKEKKKIEQTKQRLLKALEIGHYLGAKCVVFHPAFYQGRDKEKVYNMVKDGVLEIEGIRKKNKWTTKLAAETTGKATQWGDLDEVIRLSKETGILFCVDFAHLYARDVGKIDYDEVFKKLKPFQEIHCHFSGINYGPKGERSHKVMEQERIDELAKYFKKYQVSATITSESPDTFNDAVRMKNAFEKLGIKSS